MGDYRTDEISMEKRSTSPLESVAIRSNTTAIETLFTLKTAFDLPDVAGSTASALTRMDIRAALLSGQLLLRDVDFRMIG